MQPAKIKDSSDRHTGGEEYAEIPAKGAGGRVIIEYYQTYFGVDGFARPVWPGWVSKRGIALLTGAFLVSLQNGRSSSVCHHSLFFLLRA